MKYFCMVGSHDVGFPRLIKALDEFAGKYPKHRFQMQIGSTLYHPIHSSWYDFKPALDLDIEDADIIITHGSLCLFEALKAGKKLVVIPRQAKYGEHINDHQVQFSKHIAKLYGFPVLMDVRDLERTLMDLEFSPSRDRMVFPETRLHLELAKYLEKIAGQAGSNHAPA